MENKHLSKIIYALAYQPFLKKKDYDQTLRLATIAYNHRTMVVTKMMMRQYLILFLKRTYRYSAGEFYYLVK